MRILHRLRSRRIVITAQIDEWYCSLFPTPAEVRLIEILGGRTLRLSRFQKDGLPMTVILSRGRVLRREHFKRTGDTLILFSNDLKMGLAIQGREYERDIVQAFERDEWLRNHGYRIQYIPVQWLRSDPERVRMTVGRFLYS